jgi:membrane protease YdiL (CAAX protease family)
VQEQIDEAITAARNTPDVGECPSCGQHVTPGSNYCGVCGARVVATGKVPWGLGDIALVLIVPVIFFGLNVVGGLLVSEEDTRLSEGELISTFVISMGFQAFLLGVAWWFSVRKYRVSWAELGLRRPARGGWWFPFALVVGAFVVVYAWIALLFALSINGDGDVPDGTFDYASSVILLTVLSVGFAPVIEEIFFRGFLFGGFRSRLGLPAGLLLSAGIFSLAHAGTPESFLVLPGIAGVGALFAWSYAYTGSLWGSIGAHFLFNLASLSVGLATS